MTRIADLATNTSIVNLLQGTQERLHNAQVQVSSEKLSQTYDGLARESQRLVNIENTDQRIQRYSRNNDIMTMRLTTLQTTNEAIEKVIDDFREQLDNFIQGDMTKEAQVAEIQDFAYQALQNIEAYLDTRIDGQYLFGGSRTGTQPVDFLWDSKASFQSMYDGTNVTYPVTKASHINQKLIDPNISLNNAATGNIDLSASGQIIAATANAFSGITVGQTITMAGSATAGNDGTYTVTGNTGTILTVAPPPGTLDAVNGGITIDVGTGDLDLSVASTITAANAGAFQNVPVGATIRLSGANTIANDQTYTVTANTGTSLTVSPAPTIDGVASSGATINVDSWYGGDSVTRSHRLDDARTLSLTITAEYPAYEKAIRGLGIILQGVYGTAGGLDQNTDRANDAHWLLGSALEEPQSGTPPYGTETTGNMDQLDFDTGYDLTLLKDTNERFLTYSGFLQQQISDIEDIDLTLAVTNLQDQARALEASYKAFAQIQRLSLSDFL